jgi:hypothetical protein
MVLFWYASGFCIETGLYESAQTRVYDPGEKGYQACLITGVGTPFNLHKLLNDADVYLASWDKSYYRSAGAYERPESFDYSANPTINYTHVPYVMCVTSIVLILLAWIMHFRRANSTSSIALGGLPWRTIAHGLVALLIFVAAIMLQVAAYAAYRILDSQHKPATYHAMGQSLASAIWSAFVAQILATLGYMATEVLRERLSHPNLYPPDPRGAEPTEASHAAEWDMNGELAQAGARDVSGLGTDEELPAYSRHDPLGAVSSRLANGRTVEDIEMEALGRNGDWIPTYSEVEGHGNTVPMESGGRPNGAARIP